MKQHERVGFRFFPDDVLFFRDGRPSTRGDDHHLRSLFPPHPSTLYGAIRTRRLLDAGVTPAELRRRKADLWNQLSQELRDELGEWLGFGTLHLRGPWLVRGEDEILLPAPADLAIVLEDAEGRPSSRSGSCDPASPRANRVVRFLPGDPEEGGHSHDRALLHPFEWHEGRWMPWAEATEPRRAEGWYITASGFLAWAEGRAPEPSQLVSAGDLWIEEPRVGIGLEPDTRSARDGLLYTFGFIRLQPGISLGFDIRGSALEPGRRIVLGGEGRTGWLESGPCLPDVGDLASAAVRLAFTTPALSVSGASLPGLDARKLRPIGACVPGYTLVGGWDLAKGGPKALRRALPFGSVFLLRMTGEEPLPLADLHGRNLSDYPDEHLDLQGFGLVLAGIEPQR